MIKAVWILLDVGPCIYCHATEKRFEQTDENLYSGFFSAMETFANSIGSEEVLRVDLRDLTLTFMRQKTLIFVVASDRNEDMSETLLKVSRVFTQVVPDLLASNYNPLISSDAITLHQRIDSKIKEILSPQVPPLPPAEVVGVHVTTENDVVSSVLPKNQSGRQSTVASLSVSIVDKRGEEPLKQKAAPQHVRLRGDMIPRLEKPLTDALRERERLIKRFGVVAVDILHLADGGRTVDQIVEKSNVQRIVVEDILGFCEKLGIIEFRGAA
jgi:hypothetical protein